MNVYSTSNLMTSTPTVEVRLEWDEWEGMVPDRDLLLIAAGAAGRHTWEATQGASIHAYTRNYGEVIPSGHDCTDATGVIVWVTIESE